MLDKSPSIIGGRFDRIASTYDRLNTILSFSIDKSWRRAAIDLLEIRKGDAVLDVATGTGEMALLAASHEGRVTGIDLSRQMLLLAASKARAHRLGDQCSVVQGDALFMPFRNEIFNSAVVAFGIRNMVNLEGFLDEIYGVLNPCGRFSILEFSMPENYLFRRIYLAYLSHILPVLGGILSGDYETYRYLRDSIMAFPDPKVLESIMERRGFHVVRSKSLLGGIAHLYLLQK